MEPKDRSIEDTAVSSSKYTLGGQTELNCTQRREAFEEVCALIVFW
jgi:hypothetical protein